MEGASITEADRAIYYASGGATDWPLVSLLSFSDEIVRLCRSCSSESYGAAAR